MTEDAASGELGEQAPVSGKSFVLWGGTGQAHVVRPILNRLGLAPAGIFENGLTQSPFADMPLLGGDAEFDQMRASLVGVGFVVAIGGAHGGVRTNKSLVLAEAGLVPLQAIHHTSFVADTASVGAGCQVMALAAICEQAKIGAYSIVNTKASVDHGCRLGIGVHVMPGATLAGLVEVQDYATIGAGAVILPRIRIGHGAMVGAGAVVTKDVQRGSTVVGCPAHEIRKELS